MPPRQPILLDESAIQKALRRKRSLGGYSVDDPSGVIPTENTTGGKNVPQKRPTEKILLDEHQLRHALQVKAERRRAAEESTDRRNLARSSMDRFLDDSNVPSVAIRTQRARPPKKSKGRTEKSQQIVDGALAINETESILESTSTMQGEPARISKKTIKARESLNTSIGNSDSTTSQHATNSKSKSQTPVVTRKLHDVSSEPIAPENVGHATADASKNVGARGVRRASSKKSQSSMDGGSEQTTQDDAKTIHKGDVRSQRRPSASRRNSGTSEASNGVERNGVRRLSKKRSSKKKVVTQDSTHNTPPPQPTQPVSVPVAIETAPSRSPPPKLQSATSQQSIQSETTQSRRKSSRPPLPPKPPNQVPSKGSIHTASTTKPPSTTNDSVSTMEDHSTIPNSSDHSQPISWGCIPIPHSTKDHPSSFNSQPPSWSIRNQSRTGFAPNEYITKETMTTYTNNLGGVQTVATTTRIFHDKAAADPELKVFFKKIRWEHVRNEFIILANLQVPDRFDESLRGMLEHHCRLLENGADMDRLISIWESAIESSWLENRRDDARQLIVGPSRVIFNLKALERHYAMYQKGLRAASRREKGSPPESAQSEEAPSRPPRRGLLVRLRRGKQ